MSAERKYAAQILQKVLEEKIFYKDAQQFYHERTAGHEKFITMLVLTCLRKKEFLERTLKKYIKKPLKNKDIPAKYLLLCAACEIFYLQSPDYAVINEYVGLIKQQNGRFLSSMANAVLRNILKDKNALSSNDKGRDFPKGFLFLVKKDYGEKIAAQIEKEYCRHPKLDISVKSEIADKFSPAGAHKVDLLTCRFDAPQDVEKIEGYADGKWWVQDYSASLAVKIAGNLKGKKVLDLCAAPGGKTAQLIDAGAIVTAVDISASRIEKLKQNMKRLGFENKVEIVCADAFEFLQNRNIGEYDLILLDAPCSATGTLRRHPETIFIKSVQDIEKMSKIQERLLEETCKKISRGGFIIYCVCSMFKSEGEKIADKFLSVHPEFAKISPDKKLFADERILSSGGYVRTLPFYAGGIDSFFMAHFQKITDI